MFIKKLISCLLVTALVFGTVGLSVIAESKTALLFTDVSSGDSFFDAVEYVYSNKFMDGTSETEFQPFSAITRAMFTTVLWRADGKLQANLLMPFSDVPDGEYYTEAVRWAAAKKLVNGTTPTTFEPDRAINREEMAALLYRYAQTKGLGFTGAWAFPLKFSDAKNVSDWAYEALCWLTMPSVGIMDGINGAIEPQKDANRYELAVALKKITELTAEMSNTDVLLENNVRFLGRHENTDNGYSFNWTGSGFEFTFNGTKAEINVGKVLKNSYFTVYVDGAPLRERVKINEGYNTIVSGLPDKEHTIKFVRSSEAVFGRCWIKSIRTDGSKPIPTNEKERKIEFYGDSYMCGYGDLGIVTEEREWGNADNSDHQKAFPTYICDRFDADESTIAYSGKGIILNGENSTGLTIPEYFNYTDVIVNGDTETPSLWDFSKYTPNLVVVLTGANDMFGFADANDYAVGYEKFIRELRKIYPGINILCLGKPKGNYPDETKKIVSIKDFKIHAYMDDCSCIICSYGEILHLMIGLKTDDKKLPESIDKELKKTGLTTNLIDHGKTYVNAMDVGNLEKIDN